MRTLWKGRRSPVEHQADCGDGDQGLGGLHPVFVILGQATKRDQPLGSPPALRRDRISGPFFLTLGTFLQGAHLREVHPAAHSEEDVSRVGRFAHNGFLLLKVAMRNGSSDEAFPPSNNRISTNKSRWSVARGCQEGPGRA